jgi:tRNA(Ile2) C34 agmatinyltransferase TiaS
MTTRKEIANKINELGFATKPTKKLIDFIISEIAAAERRARYEVASNIWRIGTTEGINDMRKYIKDIIAENSETEFNDAGYVKGYVQQLQGFGIGDNSSKAIDVCPTCGKMMSVVGNTTKHYECTECGKE